MRSQCRRHMICNGFGELLARWRWPLHAELRKRRMYVGR